MADEPVVTVYGTTWCPDCWRAKKVLEAQRVDYVWINIDEDAAAADRVKALNGGMRSVPTIVFPNGKMVVEPSNAALLQAVLAWRQRLP